MRNLKKVLSLVLCVAMLLSVMVMGTGAVTLTDSEDISPQYREAAEVLTGMGIINGYEDDSFKPQQSITRAEVAAMIYRVATGDVEDEKADINAGAKIFTDVDPDDWYAGYVNYCGDAEYIKGFEDDSFRADENVTGYQVLAMILRAVGYDKNNEFTGTNWTINVASTAMQEGLLKNVDGSVDLSAPATRELVAEFIFRAIHPDVETVHYVPAAGIYRDEGSSLGEQVFDLAVVNDNDVWGRPATIWYAESSTYWNGAVKNDGYQSDKDDLYVTIEEEALATYTTAVKICDVADDLGIAEETFTTYTNGEVNDGTVKIDADATTDTIGAQGRLTEVYEDTIVYIDTFLAEVTGVTEVKYDADGHVAKDASLTLLVYANDAGQEIILKDDTNYTYAEGDMLLVNAVTDGAGWHDAIATDDDQHIEFLGAAESFVGAQTYIQWNDNQHTVDGDVYNDALHFHLDIAGQDDDINYNWYLDQYGNLIGNNAIDRTNYAVLKDMTWTSGQAEATLLYMNGEEATVPVNTIDGNSYGAEFEHFWAVRADDATPVMAASTTGFFGDEARVSHDDVYNDVYDGFALYQVYTNDDGSVDLQGFEENTNDGLIIDYANRATLDVSGSEILNNGRVAAHVDASTQIIVNNGDGTYSTYTGTDALADFANRSIEVFWSIEDGFTQNVYIKSYVEQAAFGEHLFTTNKTVGHEVGNTGYYEMVVYVDGVERTIVTDADVMTTLVNNTGKLFHVRWDVFPMDFPSSLRPNDTYGYVTDVDLVNEAFDGDGAGECNYLSGNVTVGEGAIIDQVTNHSYNLTSATQVIYNGNVTYTIENLKDAVDEGMGIWVVDNARDGVSRNAAAIYIGTKLSDDTSATVTATYNDETYPIQPDANNADLYNIETPVGVNSANIVVDPTHVNAVVVDTLEAISHPWASAMNADPATTWSLTIVAEDGVTERDITVSVKEADPTVIDNAVTYIRNGMNNAVLAENVDVYYDIEEAAANAITLTNDNAYTNAKLTIDTTYLTNTDLEIVRFTAGADAVNEDAFNSATATVVGMSGGVSDDIQINDVESGTVVVVALTARDTAISDAGTVYFAFRVVNP